MADWACKNPQCQSFGSPHPNCRCGGPGVNTYANGGRVSSFCDSDTPHDKNCQYFAEGGEGIPQDQVIPDAPTTEIPQDQVVPDAPKQDIEVPASEVVPDAPQSTPDDKYSTTGQQIGAGLEGAAQGFLGPVATGAELGLSKLGVPGLSAEDQAGRAAANPYTHGIAEAAALGASMYTGVGEARLALKAAEAAAQAAKMGRVGSAVVKGVTESAALMGGDEISKAMLGQGDPEAPTAAALAHIGAAGLLGAITHIPGAVLSKGSSSALTAIENAKLGTKAESFLRGLGSKSLGIAAHELEVPPASDIAFRAGEKAHEAMIKSVADDLAGGASKAIAGVASSVLPGGLVTYEILQSALHRVLRPTAERAITVGNKYVPGAAAKALSMGETSGLFNIMDHATNVSKGAQKMAKGVDSLFKVGGQQAINVGASERDREKIKEYIENGGINQELQPSPQPSPTSSFAQGGPVELPTPGTDAPNPVATVYPEQNMMMQAAKMRVSNYLNSLRPQPSMNVLPFDRNRKDPEKERTYNRAINVAANPLGVLEHIRAGTLQPEHVAHLSQMYPEVYSSLSKQVTKRMMESKEKGEKPSYRTRQMLSAFLKAPLDSTLTQQGIMNAQMTFAPKPTPPSSGGKKPSPGSKTSIDKLPGQYQTLEQSSEMRRQRTT